MHLFYIIPIVSLSLADELPACLLGVRDAEDAQAADDVYNALKLDVDTSSRSREGASASGDGATTSREGVANVRTKRKRAYTDNRAAADDETAADIAYAYLAGDRDNEAAWAKAEDAKANDGGDSGSETGAADAAAALFVTSRDGAHQSSGGMDDEAAGGLDKGEQSAADACAQLFGRSGVEEGYGAGDAGGGACDEEDPPWDDDDVAAADCVAAFMNDTGNMSVTAGLFVKAFPESLARQQHDDDADDDAAQEDPESDDERASLVTSSSAGHVYTINSTTVF